MPPPPAHPRTMFAEPTQLPPPPNCRSMPRGWPPSSPPRGLPRRRLPWKKSSQRPSPTTTTETSLPPPPLPTASNLPPRAHPLPAAAVIASPPRRAAASSLPPAPPFAILSSSSSRHSPRPRATTSQASTTNTDRRRRRCEAGLPVSVSLHRASSPLVHSTIRPFFPLLKHALIRLTVRRLHYMDVCSLPLLDLETVNWWLPYATGPQRLLLTLLLDREHNHPLSSSSSSFSYIKLSRFFGLILNIGSSSILIYLLWIVLLLLLKMIPATFY